MSQPISKCLKLQTEHACVAYQYHNIEMPKLTKKFLSEWWKVSKYFVKADMLIIT